jgi:hypothetical protein
MGEPMTNTMTCVYLIKDHKAFEEERKKIFSKFKDPIDEPWAITAIGCGDEVRRLELLEEAHNKGLYDLMDKIFGLIDPRSVESIHDLYD